MREFSTPLTFELPTTGNLTDAVVRHAREVPGAALLTRPVGPAGTSAATWRDVSAGSFHDEVVAVAKGLVASGVEVGDRVALVARTRYAWTLLDYAIWFAGAVSVPVYDSSPADEQRHVLADAGAVLAVVDHPRLAAGLDARPAAGAVPLPELREVLILDPEDPHDPGAIAVLGVRGDSVSDAELERRRTTPGPGDLATLVYSSGTTGAPSSCMLTHGQLAAEIAVTRHELAAVYAEGSTTLLFLPLAHVFARVVQIGCIEARVKLAHSSDPARLVERLAAVRPTFVLAVPRVFERLFTTASQRATADGRGPAFDRSVETAIAWSRGLDRGRPSWRLRARHRLLDRAVHDDIAALLGGACVVAVSGGAPLGERLGHLYRGIEIPVLEGYGLTETCAAITANVPGAHKVGTVGRPLPGAAVRVADDGELLVRGPQVFAGYWRDPGRSAAALEPDGWLHTGDVGEVDDEGFVRVTGRKQELLVTAGGKAVSPVVLEERLRAHPLVSQALVVGDRQPYVGALVTLDPEAVALWDAARRPARQVRQGRRSTRPAKVRDLVEDPALLAAVQRAVDDANAAVSRAESIRRFRVLPTEWTEEGGELTPSLKLRRSVVLRAYKDDVAALYV